MKKQSTKIKFKIITVLFLLSFFLQSVAPALACGPFTLDPLFEFTKHPDYPLVEYNKGNVGIVPDSFGRMSLFVFYRQLNDLPLTALEQKQVAAAMRNRISIHWSDSSDAKSNVETSVGTISKKDVLKMWETARAKVLGGDVNISTEKREEDDYDYYYNCLPDSFKTATQTLESRIAKYGTGADVKEWVNGQDAVFSNCSESGKVPEQSAANSSDWLKKDRQYQIAAALFYEDKLPESRTAFEQIASDNNSTWNKTAKFVVARTYIRQASFIDDENPDYEPVTTPVNSNTVNTNSAANYGANIGNTAAVSLTPEPKISKSIEEKKREKNELQQKAIAQLRNILTDTSMNEFHASAQRLLNLVEYRSIPEQRRRELSQILVLPGENLNIYNDLTDYIWLLDRVESDAQDVGSEIDRKVQEQAGKVDYGYEYSLKIRDVPAEERSSDLTDWLFSYQSDDSYAHALEKWQATQKNHWLVLALVKANAQSPQISELLNAADKIPMNSSALPTARYQQIRLLLETGKRAEATQKLNEVFAGNFSKYNISTQNKFYSQRMATSQNLDEFLKYAQRRPATFVWSDDANEEGTDLKSPAVFDETDLSDKKLQVWADRTMFDDDAVAFFNEKMPLSVLRQAALNPQLPDYLKKFLVVAVWTRAFVLNNQPIEREFAPMVLKYAPEYKPLFSKYSIASGANSEATALITILRYPVIQPFVPIGYGRDDSDPTSIDSIRGNWWCVKNQDEEYPVYYDHYDFTHPKVYPNFLTPAQTAEAEREQKQLTASGNSATYLTRRAIEFAKRNPNHPQTPEILHLAVRSTRYGCKDAETGKYSQEAFNILHRRYPNSTWTKQTPYWFSQNS